MDALKYKVLLPILVLLPLLAPAAFAQRVVAVNVDGVVHPITGEILDRAIDQARDQNAAVVLVRLSTPGGLLEATRHIVESIIGSPVPVVTYVTPSGARAASAGFFVLQAGDVAAMSPGTNTGAATPVLFGQQMEPEMRAKVQNDAAAWVRSIVDQRRRNAELAQTAVLEGRSFTEQEALKDNLIDLIASNEAELLRQLDGRQITRFDGRQETLKLGAPQVVEYELTLRQRIMRAIADPNIALVLLVLGALGIYIEFSAPGMIAPGVGGAILLLLGLSALTVLPINWVGVALLVLALVLFILEANFVSHGILTAGGTAAMILGALLLIESPLPELRIRLSTAIALALPFAIITTFLLSLVIRARTRKVVTGTSGMVDEVGVARTALDPAGKVFVHGELWDAVSSKPVEAGARVRVTDVQGLTLNVEPVLDGAAASGDGQPGTAGARD